MPVFYVPSGRPPTLVSWVIQSQLPGPFRTADQAAFSRRFPPTSLPPIALVPLDTNVPSTDLHNLHSGRQTHGDLPRSSSSPTTRSPSNLGLRPSTSRMPSPKDTSNPRSRQRRERSRRAGSTTTAPVLVFLDRRCKRRVVTAGFTASFHAIEQHYASIILASPQ